MGLEHQIGNTIIIIPKQGALSQMNVVDIHQTPTSFCFLFRYGMTFDVDLFDLHVFWYDNNCVSNLVFETHYSLFSLHHLQKATRHPNPSLRIAGKQTLQPY